MKVYASTNVGKIRPNNEDSYYAPEAGERFCCVADGMGGHRAGEIASQIAVREFAREMREPGDAPADERLRKAVERANRVIFEEAQANEAYGGMGTTMTALCREGDEVFLAHVGDSRAYLVRNRAILRVTTDHTLVEEMVLEGLITVQEARVHPKRNIITRVLGTGDRVEVDSVRLKLMKGDQFLLCSDGLSNAVTERDMLEILTSRLRGGDKVETLIELALERGGHDNITALLAVPEEDRS